MQWISIECHWIGYWCRCGRILRKQCKREMKTAFIGSDILYGCHRMSLWDRYIHIYIYKYIKTLLTCNIEIARGWTMIVFLGVLLFFSYFFPSFRLLSFSLFVFFRLVLVLVWNNELQQETMHAEVKEFSTTVSMNYTFDQGRNN